MVIQRKGKAVKFEKIQKALRGITDVREAFRAIERFNLSNIEENDIIGKWKIEQQILRCHGIIA
jgi:hypothetical protein